MSTSTLPYESIINFLEHLEVERNLSPLTIRNYGHYLNRFAQWFKNHGYKDIKELDQEVLRKYRVYLNRYTDKHGDPLSRKTQSYYIIALRSWLKWLVKNDARVLQPEKVDLPKGESQHMQFLSIEQMERLMNQPNLSSKAGLRDKVILEVLFSTGLRVSELVSLNRDQVDTKRREFGVIGKGRRPRVVFLSDRAVVWLDRWLNSREDDWRPVFIRFSGKKPELFKDGEEMRLTARSVQRLVDKYAKRAKLPVKISPHGIRHTFATDLLANGAGLREVQEMLGHKNIATTQIYTHVTRPQLRKMHQKFHSDL
ncbi:tyrosine-type recombinase/integrase [Patescibacteria group bacterium]|nr:tyrosine-type recombinase/integrase [Patescibacteria group bacterium]MBU1885308.1 tyrosine-type recombinase/integrase [Patescibacteria group bacterium]